jgi:hypothetical protein
MQQMQFRHRTTKKHKCEKHESDEVFSPRRASSARG